MRPPCKQYKVAAGEKIKVEQISADIGAGIEIDQVLAVYDGDKVKIGAPLVGGTSVRLCLPYTHNGLFIRPKLGIFD